MYKITANYQELFGTGDSDTDAQDSKTTEKEMILMWFQVADNIAEVARVPLMSTFSMDVMEFFNFMSYINHKNSQIKKNNI